MSKITVKEWLSGLRYDPYGTHVFNKNNQLVLDVRGWGPMHKTLGIEEGAKFQDEVAATIIAAIDSYLNPKSPWRPISEAPKDGTEILTKEYDDYDVVQWREVSWAKGWYSRRRGDWAFFDPSAVFMLIPQQP